MNSVNPVLVQIFYRSAIANMPEKKREIYQYITTKEEELEKIAVSVKQFMELRVNHSPFKEASSYFPSVCQQLKRLWMRPKQKSI